MYIELNACQLKYLIEVINEVSRLIKQSDDRVVRLEVCPDTTRLYTYSVLSSARETKFMSYKQAMIQTSSIITGVSSPFVVILSDINNTVRLLERLEGDSIKGKIDVTDRGVMQMLQLKDDALRVKLLGSDGRLLESISEEKVNALVHTQPLCTFELNKTTYDRVIKLMRSNTTADTIRINVSKEMLKFDDRKWTLNICEVKGVDEEWTFKRDYISQHKPSEENSIIFKAYEDKIMTVCGEYMLMFATEIEAI